MRKENSYSFLFFAYDLLGDLMFNVGDYVTRKKYDNDILIIQIYG